MNSPSKSAQAARTSTRVSAQFSPDGPAASAAVLLNAAVVGIVGLFSSTRSVLVTLIRFCDVAVLTGWYLWTQRELAAARQADLELPSANERQQSDPGD